MSMVCKRGFGHVEAILSFVIFISFIVFAFVFFSPFQSNRTLQSTLDYAWREITDVTEQDLKTYSLVIDSSAPIVAIAIPGVSGFNASVQNSSGSAVPSYTDSAGAVHFQKPINSFARILFAPRFTAGTTLTGVLLPAANYSISSSENSPARFEQLALDLNATYFANYTGLKKQFNLPNRVHFGFSFKFIDGSEIRASREIPENAEVLSRDDRLSIVRASSKNVEYADVSVFVW